MTNNAWNTPDSSANGQLLIGQAGGRPVWATLTEGAGVTITNGAGSITMDFDAGSSDFELISSAVASDDATIDFTGLSSSYSSYIVEVEGLQSASDQVQLWLRTSSDNGSNYDDSASDYSYAIYSVCYAIEDAEADATEQYILLAGTTNEKLGNASNEILSGRLWIFNPSASEYTKVAFMGAFQASHGDETRCSSGGARVSAAAVNAIQFLCSSGNISTGNFKLYGFKA